jgi:hypothetical protein
MVPWGPGAGNGPWLPDRRQMLRVTDMGRRKATKHKRSRLAPKQRNRWTLIIDSKEAAVNLYSILLAFRQSEGKGLIDRKEARHIAKWLKVISEQIPDVRDLADSSRGPLRERDLSPISVSLELDSRERALMLFICKTIHRQLTTPEGQRHWIENQGRADYELAAQNFRSWVNSLEEERVSADE